MSLAKLLGDIKRQCPLAYTAYEAALNESNEDRVEVALAACYDVLADCLLLSASHYDGTPRTSDSAFNVLKLSNLLGRLGVASGIN